MTLDKSSKNIQKIFNNIASKYDFINNVISLGSHYRIKQKCLKNFKIQPHDTLLDLCCGTGDLCQIAKDIQPLALVTGVDFSENMLKIANAKTHNIKYIQSDVNKLPFENNSFNFVTISFGLRNLNNPEKTIEEIYRVLKPNGKFMHIDFGEHNILNKIFNFTVPLIAKVLTKYSYAYEYLIKSKKIFPTPDELIKDFTSKNFKFEKRQDFLFGSISCQIFSK